VSVLLPQLPSMQITYFLPRIILSSMACLALLHSPTLSHNRQEFRKKCNKCKMRVLILSIASKYFSFYEEFSEILSHTYKYLHVKYTPFLSDYNQTRIFSTDFQTIPKFQISWKSVQWEQSCSLWTEAQTATQTDGHTDVTKLITAFLNFVNAP
jgi:hypothetical protein